VYIQKCIQILDSVHDAAVQYANAQDERQPQLQPQPSANQLLFCVYFRTMLHHLSPSRITWAQLSCAMAQRPSITLALTGCSFKVGAA